MNSNLRSLRPRRRAGYTLIELCLVIAIIALVGMMAWPSLNAWFQGYRLGQGVDEVRTHWIKARTLAMNEGRPYRFTWEPEGAGYRLAPDDLEHWPELADSVSGPRFTGSSEFPGLIVDGTLPDGVRFSELPEEAGSSLTFLPDGQAKITGPDGSEFPQLHLLMVDRFNGTRALQVRALTGGVSVVDLNAAP